MIRLSVDLPVHYKVIHGDKFMVHKALDNAKTGEVIVTAAEGSVKNAT